MNEKELNPTTEMRTQSRKANVARKPHTRVGQASTWDILHRQGTGEWVGRKITVGERPRTLTVTAGARTRVSTEDIFLALTLHGCGDFGQDFETSPDVYQKVLPPDVRGFSAFRNKDWLAYWVISRTDNSITVLLPTEYDPDWKDPADD